MNFIPKTFAQEGAEEYIISNPTDELSKGVINAGNIPSISDLANSTGQIANSAGLQGAQYILFFIITSLLKLIGVAALIGILFNAFKLIIQGGEDDKHDAALKGIKFSVMGLAISLLSHAIVTMIIQILNRGDELF